MGEDIRVFLVDDEPLVLRSMEKTLLRAGFDVETAGDARAGLALFEDALGRQEPFHVAVLDLNMPDLDGQGRADAGLHLLARIRELDQDVPVIVLTAFDEVIRAKEAVSLGARAYFVKGREAGLIDLINTLLSDGQRSEP